MIDTPGSRSFLTAAVVLGLLGLLGCASGGTRSPWSAPEQKVPAAHAEVRTKNPGYRRTEAQVLVREVDRPTRANLDFAAYHANFLIAEPPPEGEQPAGAPRVDPAELFRGVLEPGTMTGSIRQTPLTEAERARPLALAPLAQWMAEKQAKLAAGLEEIGSAVREENWGLGAGPPLPRQQATEVYLHGAGGGKPPELWVKVEFAPWWKGFSELPDEDGDGVAEVYGRARADLLPPGAAALIAEEYTGKTLSPTEVHAWAHKLASYWYPSYNTDLASSGARWPDDQTEPDVRGALNGYQVDAPTVVMRGKPEGKAVYNVFLVKGVGPRGGAAGGAALKLAAGTVTPDPQPVAAAIKKELALQGGGSWDSWRKQVQPFQTVVRKHLRSVPAAIKGLPGLDGYLFYRNSLEYTVGGDLEKQPRAKSPLAVIVQWKEFLAKQGVDFLFVPVPTKVEVYPDKLDETSKNLAGRIVNPFSRKLLLALAEAGVEVVDLWPPFLARRREKGPEIFQRQDTHWTSAGLELAAARVAERVRRYPWYKELEAHRRSYTTREAPFSRHGDLHTRLPEPEKKRHQPEAVVGRQVLGPDGKPYEDDAGSPIVVLGDSFTGVLQETDCRHAGVSAHLARELGYPVDLVMSYGGGPNVRHKLMRRGAEDLKNKRLVIWMMTARDLYNYWEDWEPLAANAK
jgi:alginate O-acetyltransferase complex protein AlgJ